MTKGTLPEGKSFGFVHHFDGTALYVDPAELFGNEEATQAAREDGQLPEGGLPNPFYIRNRDQSIVRIPVARDMAVTLIDNVKVLSKPITSPRFAQLYCAGADTSWLYSNLDHIPMNLRVSAGRVVRADEQYLP